MFGLKTSKSGLYQGLPDFRQFRGMGADHKVPNHALYHLSYTRIFYFLILSLWSKMWSNGDFQSFCGRNKEPKP